MHLILQHFLPKGFRRSRDFWFLHGNAKKLLFLILEAVHQNREITIRELAASIGITERSIERNIQSLQREGRRLRRVVPAKAVGGNR